MHPALQFLILELIVLLLYIAISGFIRSIHNEWKDLKQDINIEFDSLKKALKKAVRDRGENLKKTLK